jgi:hypothetical protein
MVIRRRTNAAGAENHIARSKGPGQHGLDALWLITHVLRIRQRQTSIREQVNHFVEMLVGSFPDRISSPTTINPN